MIEIKNLYKSFDDKKVLQDINGTFQQGKTNLIIGASGSGKSVLLKNTVNPTQARFCIMAEVSWMQTVIPKPRFAERLACSFRAEHFLTQKM